LRTVALAALTAPAFLLRAVRRALPAGSVPRTGIAIALAALIGFSAIAIGASRPESTTAQKPRPILPLPAAALRTDLRTGQSPDAAVEIAFTQAMDPASVRAALDVQPAGAIRADWNRAGTVLTVAPLRRWATGTYYTITVQPGALSADGVPLSTPVRAVFLTRPTTAATIGLTRAAGERARIDTGFVVEFDGPLDPATIRGALRVDPPVAGAWARVDAAPGDGAHADAGGARTDAAPAAARWAFTPVGRLAADTTYRISLADTLRDADGAKVESRPLEVRTATAPRVVRFRPRDGTSNMTRGADLAVRFSEPMDRATTEAAFSATVKGTALKGRLTWKDGDTVLVLDPASNLDHDQRIVLGVTGDATSVNGVPLAAPARAAVRTEAPPPPPPTAEPSRSSSGSGGSGGSGGGSVGSGNWTAVEAYYLKLMNCTRTGGWVTSSGGCSSPGGRDVAALKLDGGISSKVARPYARKLAVSGGCSHGDPGARLRAAGYTSYIWAENLGCRSGDPYAAVLGSHLFFQAEKPTNGGHYVNLMNAKYDRVGIGVWVSGGRVRLVVDFYHPR
jgi:uncharacterized protein YkwD